MKQMLVSRDTFLGTLRRIAFFACALLFIPACITPALGQKRAALVVGNNAYQNLGGDKQLTNAISDARAVRDALQVLGFEVLYGENLDRGAMINRLFDLAARLGPNDTAFFFFAGHGVSLSGANYLLPSDIPAPQATGRAEEGRLAEQAIAETTVIDRITQSGARVAVVVLDACRNNPLQGSDRRSVGGSRGLSQSQSAKGVFSIYSAGFGQEALDRLGPNDRHPNSVFTRVFVEKLKTPGLDLRAVATQTRSVVVELAQKVGHEQFPAYYDQVIGDDIYLAGLGAKSASQATSPSIAPPVADPAERAWAAMRDTTSIAVLESYIAQFGDTAYGAMARARLQELRKIQVAVATPPAQPVTPQAAQPVRPVAGMSQLPAPSSVTPALIAAAKKEGKVVWYTSVDLPLAEKISRAFEARFPGVAVRVERTGAERVFTRIAQEYASRVHAVDVVNSSDAAHFIVWKRDGLLAPYVPEDVAKYYPAEHRDPDGMFATWRAWLSVIGYNTTLVKPEEAPKSFADLLDPKWAGKIVKAHPGYSGTIMTATYQMSRDLGWEYFEKLAQQRVMQVQSSADPPKKLALGERAIMADGNEYNMFQLKERGDPVEIVYPTEGAPLIVGPNAVMKNAPNPNAARLFQSWMFTVEAQQLMVDVGGLRSFHPLIKEKPGRKQLKEIKVLKDDPMAVEKLSEEIKARYTRLFKV